MNVEAIIEGKHFCLFEVLDDLRRKVGSPAILLFEESRERWDLTGIVGEELREGFVAELATLLGTTDDSLKEWSYRHHGPGLTEPVFFVSARVPVPFPNRIKRHVIVFVKPVFMSPAPEHEVMLEYSRVCRTPVIAWLAWAAYSRQRLKDELISPEDGKIRWPGNAVVDSLLRWPMGLEEMVYLARAALPPDMKRGDEKANAEITRIGDCLCLTGENRRHGAAWCDWENRPCRRSPRRKASEALAPLIPWRFGASDEELEEKKYGDTIMPLLVLSEKLRLGAGARKELGGKQLDSYFGHHFWTQWMEKWEAFAQGRGTRERLLRAGTLLAHDLIGDMPVEEETIEALVWAVSRYGHDVLGIEPRLDITSHLLQSARNEPALHVLKQYYRDHFFHSLEVCFLGHLLLEEVKLGGGRKLIDVVRERLRMGSNREVLREWYVAALFHDIGYTVEILLGVEEALKFYRRSKELGRLSEGIGRLVDGLSEEVHGRLFEGFRMSDKPGRDHGVVGALHLQSLVDHIKKQKPGAYGYPLAVKAIAAHNHRGKHPKFSTDPLTFLLVLCDTLQEWNRPHLFYSTAAATMLSRLFFRSEIGESGGPLVTSSVRLPDGIAGSPKKIEFELVYGDEINTNAGVFHLWLDTSSNLQRLDFDGFPLEIQLDILTPKFQRAGRMECQMDRLREAAAETHMNFLAEWFPKNSAVDYKSDAKVGVREMEHLRLDVRELTKLQPVTASMKTFFKLFSHWRGFNEDRIFAGDYASEPPG